MEAILVNNKTGQRRVEDLSLEEYYYFGSKEEHLTPGHPEIFRKEIEGVLKHLIWGVIHSFPSDYPKTDLNTSNETVKQDAAKIALERLRDKIDKILKDKKYEGLFI